ncbi:UNVERIFIED_CONTAM: hypothetical protein FKN15_007792 [Acipenser sinensis]
MCYSQLRAVSGSFLVLLLFGSAWLFLLLFSLSLTQACVSISAAAQQQQQPATYPRIQAPGAPATNPKQTHLPALDSLIVATSRPLVCANNVTTGYHSRGKLSS